MTRSDQRRDFLSRAGWSRADAVSLAGDASSRRYFRLMDPVLGPAVLMDAPPESGEDIRPFCRIADHLAGIGLSAPRLIAKDPQAGFLLLEDLGDAVFARLVTSDPGIETELYQVAIDALLDLHRHKPPEKLRPFGPPQMAAAVDVALDWYARGERIPETAKAELVGLVRSRLDALPPTAPVLALRDFHAENLIWLPEREGPARVGLLDFQDAFAGPPAYDLISLLEDARRDVSEVTRDAVMAGFAESSGQSADALALSCATLGAQRNLRILGVFARLCLHFGKAQYVDLIPRVWSHLQRDLSHPDLAPLAGFLSDLLPEPTGQRLDSLRESAGTCPMP